MTFWETIGVAVVGGVVGWLWQRNHKRRFEMMVRRYRSVMGSEIEYREAGPDDHVWVIRLDRVTPAELERQLERLPDLVMVGSERAGIVRPFVDETRTAVAYVVCAAVGADFESSIAIESHTEEDEYVSARGGSESITLPPFAHYQYLSPTISISDLLAAHRAFVGDTTCIKFGTGADVARELERKHAALAAWRNAQPADELLDQDVQKFLGARYKRHGKEWIDRLKIEVPKAQARRRS